MRVARLTRRADGQGVWTWQKFVRFVSVTATIAGSSAISRMGMSAASWVAGAATAAMNGGSRKSAGPAEGVRTPGERRGGGAAGFSGAPLSKANGATRPSACTEGRVG